MSTDSGLDHVEVTETPEGNIDVEGDQYFILSYGASESLMDAKEIDKLIKKAQRMIRSSPEYKEWVNSLKELGLTRCSILGGIDDEHAKVEMHHYPYNLYTVVEMHLDKLFAEGKSVDTFTLATNVMDSHFKGIIGVVPLSKTVHELAHSDEVKIPLSLVFGDITKYIETFYDYHTPEQFEKLRQYAKITVVHSDVLNIAKQPSMKENPLTPKFLNSLNVI